MEDTLPYIIAGYAVAALILVGLTCYILLQRRSLRNQLQLFVANPGASRETK